MLFYQSVQNSLLQEYCRGNIAGKLIFNESKLISFGFIVNAESSKYIKLYHPECKTYPAQTGNSVVSLSKRISLGMKFWVRVTVSI